MSRRAHRRLLVAMVVIVVAFAAGVIWLVRSQGAYYRQVGQLDSGLNGKTVKVGGTVKGGNSLVVSGSATEFRIKDLTGKSAAVEVRSKGALPSTFGAGVQVVVLGTYHFGGDHAPHSSYIEATAVQTKCPSKYRDRVSPTPTSASR